MIIGYARTSTADQLAGLEAQIRDLEAAGCDPVFKEQVSSVSSEREMLARALKVVQSGDTIIVTKPDRLARSTRDLLDIVEQLENKGASLVILSMSGTKIDTRNPTSRLMLTILAAVAAFERDIMLERQREGVAKAKAQGKYQGRKRIIDRHAEAVESMILEGFTVTKMMEETGLSRRSVNRVKASRCPADILGLVAIQKTPALPASAARPPTNGA